MKLKFSFKTIACITAAMAVAAGAVTVTTMTALADEAVDYYGLSADGTVISGAVTDYTRITSSDMVWGTANQETWYVADGDITVGGYGMPVEISGNVNIILKDNATVTVDGGIKCRGTEVTVYSESKDGNGIIAFIGMQGQSGSDGATFSTPEQANGGSGYDGYPAVDITKLTVSGGTVTAIGGKGGSGGQAGYGSDWINGVEVFYYGVGGNGGNGGRAISEYTDVYLNGGRFNATAGQGGDAGENHYVSASEQENYKGSKGDNGTAIDGIYAVNGTLNVNKLDDSDTTDTSGDYELLSANPFVGAELYITGKGTASVKNGTVITSYGNISSEGTLNVEDGAMVLTNGTLTSTGNVDKQGIIRRITPVADEGYTVNYASGYITPDNLYKLTDTDGSDMGFRVSCYDLMGCDNNLNVVRKGDGSYIDDSLPYSAEMPYCIIVNADNNVQYSGNKLVERNADSTLDFTVSDSQEYELADVSVTDHRGNVIPQSKYTFDKQTGRFTALDVDRNYVVKSSAKLKDVVITVTDENNTAVNAFDFGTDADNGSVQKSQTLKLNVTDGGSVKRYKVIKESDFDKTTGTVTGDTSSFGVTYSNENADGWGISDDSSSTKISVGESAVFTVALKNDIKAGTYTETYIVITDRTEYADSLSGTSDKALARFIIQYTVEHESDNKLHYTDHTGHYNLCINCNEKINVENHNFDVKNVNDDTLAKNATCTEAAEYYYSCVCGAYTDDTALTFKDGDPNGHSYGEWQESKAATCTESGKEKHICSVCKAEEERDTNPLGHDWEDDFTIDKNPTCTVPGSKSIHCTRCDVTKDETEIEPNGHKFGEWQESKAPTCTEKGTEKHICSVCKAEEERDTNPLGHDWEDDFTIDKNPTCTVPGSKSIHCTRCDVTKDETEIEPNGHKFGEWQESKAPTCTEKGTEKHICSVCKAEQERDINPLGHDWEDDFTVDKEPTCTVPGSKSIHCTRCDVTKDETEIEPNGHKFGEWQESKAPTCTEKGTEKHICSVCKTEEERDINPLGHDWDNDFTVDKNPTCTVPGSKSIHCTRCDAAKSKTEIASIGHSFGEWIEITTPTCISAGQDKRICSECGYIEYRDVAPTGHIWDDDYSVDKEPTCTETGLKSIHCTKCDETKDITEIPAKGHSFGEWELVSMEDCTEGGLENHTCTECNFVEYRNTAPMEHLWDSDFTIDIAPTCTDVGSKSIHCQRCGAVKDTTEISAVGHTFSQWSVATDATCTSAGQKTRACTVCGYTEYEDTDIDMDAHLWEADYTVDKEPTCTANGSKSIHCARCSATKDSTVIPVIDHIYGEWEIVTPATCTVDGSKKHICINCGYEESSDITSDHEWNDEVTVDKAPTCTQEGSQSIHCTKCDAIKEIQPLPANGHDWSEWETVKEATADEYGIEERFCHVCGVKEENELDLLPDSQWSYDDKNHWHDDDGEITDKEEHEFRWVVDKEPTDTEPGIGHYECISCAFEQAPQEFNKDNPVTGGESIARWASVVFIAGGIAPITLKLKRRKNK